MPLSLPPPLPPELVTVEQLAGQKAFVIAAFKGYRIHVLGDAAQRPENLDQAIQKAETLSHAVHNISTAYYIDKFPAARTLYVLVGRDLYVMVVPQRIVEIKAGPPFFGYFESMTADDPLTVPDLERRRVLASLHADRAHLNGEMKLSPTPKGLAMEIDPHRDEERKDVSLRAEYGNPGNRFVGRNFLDLEAAADSRWGDEIRVVWRQAFAALDGDEDGADDYDDYSATWNRVTPWGVFGFAGRNLEYGFKVDADSFDGRLWQVDLSWLQILYSDYQQRWSSQLKIDRIGKTTETPGHVKVQEEVYNSLEGALGFSANVPWKEWTTEAEAGLTVRGGLGDEDALGSLADLGYLLMRPTARLTFDTHKGLRLGASGMAQLTNDRTPEQQQWVLGGVGLMYAWLPGVAVGDSGSYVRIQADYADPGNPDEPHWQIVPRVFVEYARTRLENPLFGQSGTTAVLTDAGAEIVISAPKWIEASVSAAWPISDRNVDAAVLDETRADFFFRLTARY